MPRPARIAARVPVTAARRTTTKANGRKTAPKASIVAPKPSKAVAAKTAPTVVPRAPSVPGKPPAMPVTRPGSMMASAPRPASVAPAPMQMRPSNRPPSVLPQPIQPMPVREVSFKIGDKAVHPAHGLGEVTAIEHRELGGTKGLFYILRILDNGMKVMVPTNAAAQAGLRGVMSQKEANAVLDTMRAREVAVDLQPWSRRFRAYTEMIKSGSPYEIAKVLRDMHRLKFDKDLSFGERRLLDQAKILLMKELALAKKMSEQQMAEEVAGIFRA